MSAFITTFLIALIASVVGAVSGLGGALVARPLLESAAVAPSESLHLLMVVMVLFTALSRVLFSSFEEIDLFVSALLISGSLLGGILGSWVIHLLFLNLSQDLVVVIQLAVTLGLNLLLIVHLFRKSRYKGGLHKQPLFIMSLGFGLGGLSSFLGIAGGALNMMALFYFFHFTPKHAAVNSLFIILFSQGASLLLMAGSSSVPAFDGVLVALVVAGGLLGGFLGQRISRRLTEGGVRLALLLVLSGVCLLDLATILRLLF